MGEDTVVERVAKNPDDGPEGKRLAAKVSDNPDLLKFELNGSERKRTSRKLPKDSFHLWEDLWIRFHCAKFGFVEVSHRREARIYSTANFLSDATADVSGQISHVLIRDAEFERHHDDVVRRKINTLEGANFLNLRSLEKADDSSAVVKVASDAMKRPA
ncbi:MAG: hypothetical protein V4697_00745 [Patescibacteria group bacterium]